jgi:5-methylcytosine-specific restriction endonuclease McrA
MVQIGRASATWHKLREVVLKRDGYECVYCGADANSVDHIVPLKHGGEDHPDNLVAACGICNSRKRDKTVGFFLSQGNTHLRQKSDLSPGHRLLDRHTPDITVAVLHSSPFKKVS